MGKQKEFHHIRRLISRWASEIRLNNAFNYYDINILGEDIAKDLLGIIYNYNLVNLNEKQKNYPGIDLGDEKEKICFQVTSRNDVRKIKEGLEKFKKNGAAIYTRGIRFFILRDEKRDYKKETTEEFKSILPGFEPGEHIITLIDLIRDIEQLYICDSYRFNEVTALLEQEFSDRLETEHGGKDFEFTRELDKCPFKGLEDFKECDHGIFFGREEVVDDLLEKFERSRFLAILGPSGTGKSSVAQAGLLPLLKEQAMVAYLSPRERPIEELAFAIWRSYPEKMRPEIKKLKKVLSESKDSDTLHLMAREILEGTSKQEFIIFIDQFEELFLSPTKEDEQSIFIRIILDALKIDGGPVNIIITMRSDFIGNCAYYEELNRWVTGNTLQIGPMKQRQLQSAITEPAKLVGLKFEEGLVKRILQDAGDTPGKLPLIEHALYELYKKGEGALIKFRDYESIEGVKGALLKRAEIEFNKLDGEQRDVLRKMFVTQLVQTGEGNLHTKCRASKKSLIALGDDIHNTEKIIMQWSKARLFYIYTDPLRGEDFVEVCHEELIRGWPRIIDWLEEDLQISRQIRNLKRAAKEWINNHQNPDFLYKGTQLLQIKKLIKSYRLNIFEEVSQFLNAAVRQEERKKWLITCAVIALLIVTIYFAYNLRRKDESIQAEKKATLLQRSNNYWEIARRMRKANKQFHAFHHFAEAIEANSLPEIHPHLLRDMNSYWNCIPLVESFEYSLNIPVLEATFTDHKNHIILWDRYYSSYWNIESGKLVEGPIRIRLQSDDYQTMSYIAGHQLSKFGPWILVWDKNEAKVWNVNDGGFTGVHIKPEGGIFKAGFNTNESLILTWNAYGSYRLFNAVTGKEKCQFQLPEKYVWGDSLKPKNGNIGISKWSEHWSLTKGTTTERGGYETRVIKGVGMAILNSTGSRLFSYSDETAALWNPQNNKKIGQDVIHGGDIEGARFTTDERLLLTWSADGLVRMWQVENCEPYGPIIKHREKVKGAIFNSNESLILTWSTDGTARLWDAKSGKQVGENMAHEGSVNGAAFSPDETRILTWSEDRTARLWESQPGKQIGTSMMHNDSILGARFDESGSIILTWGRDGIVKVWNTGYILPKSPIHSYQVGRVNRAHFSSNGKYMLTYLRNSAVKLWDTQSGQQIGKSIRHQTDEMRSQGGAHFNAGVSRIITWDHRGAHLYDASSGKAIKEKIEHKGFFNGPVFSPNGKSFIAWHRDKGVRVLSAESGQVTGYLTGQNYSDVDYIRGAAYSINGSKILLYGFFQINLLDAQSGKRYFHKNTSPIEMFGALINPKGNSVLAWGPVWDKRGGPVAVMWDAQFGTPIGERIEFDSQINGILFNHQGSRFLAWNRNLLATTSRQETIRIFNGENCEQTAPTLKQDGSIYGAYFSRDNSFFLTCGENGMVRLWHTESGKDLGNPINHSNLVSAAVLNTDESMIISYCMDGKVYSWDTSGDWDLPKELVKIQLQVLTGIFLNTNTGELISLSPEKWRNLRERYIKEAKEHYKTCKYPQANVFKRFFPGEAKKIRDN